MRDQVAEYIVGLQDRIVTALEGLDTSSPKFKRDAWTRAQGGRGQSCVFAVPWVDPSSDAAQSVSETVLEKGGVNISIVHGALPAAAIRQMRADHGGIPNYEKGQEKSLNFFAAGLSLVIHPRNPHCPTAHANYRYFELSDPDVADDEAVGEGEVGKGRGKVLAWWFGGGADLTPSYLYEEDAIHFHQTLKNACEPYGTSVFPVFKKWCDEYFYITHRKESRGVGGIFFDDLSEDPHKRFVGKDGSEGADVKRPKTKEEIFEFIKSCGDSFVPSYVPILEKRKTTPYTPSQRRWQLIRRGRYVEFNLVYDRGTKFGLMTPDARIESILMSLPEVARWEYMSEMGEDENTEEGKLMRVVRNARDWV